MWQLCVPMMSWVRQWVGCLLKDSELFTLLAENSQILLKISVIPILLIFMYLVALNLLVNNQLYSSPTQVIIAADNWLIWPWIKWFDDIFCLIFFQKADDRLALSNAKSGMFEQRKIPLKEAPLIFNLWDNVYHQNGVKNLETNGRWDPSKLAKGMSMSIYPNLIMISIKFILILIKFILILIKFILILIKFILF